MANEWYVQHGGKQYGPMTSANLKKLAAEGKISPNTTVRLGSEGTWVPAARVQGLFAAGQPAAAPRAAQFPAVDTPPPAPKAVDLAAPPIAPPRSLPVGRPLAHVQLTNVAPLPKAVPADSGSVAPKVLGAVAIILGTVALATCWLPYMGGLVGWTGIAVGGLGLIVGIVGLVVAAMKQGTGLTLNVAGTSGSAVGLVLAIVLGIVSGFFSPAPVPKPVVIVKAPAPVVVPPPKQEAPLPKEPEPEPVWVDAKEAIQQGDIKASIVSVAIAKVVLEGGDLSLGTFGKRQKPQPMLKVRVAMENTSADKILEFGGWHGTADMLGQGVGDLLGGELAKAAKSASAGALLTDNINNKYKQQPTFSIAGAPIALGANASLRPGKTIESDLVFEPPLESVEYLRLELSPAAFNGTDSLRFQIPKEMITGLGTQ